MLIRIKTAHILLSVAAIGLFLPLPAPGTSCPTGLTYCLNDVNVTQRFQFNDGANGELVLWTFRDCTSGFETCGVATIIKKDSCKVKLVGLNDGYNIDAEVNLCLGQGKAKGKGAAFTTIGGGFQLSDADLANCPDCP